MFSSNA
jgi:hypothetical protein